MMGQSMVLGFLSIKAMNTLTPLWLVGVGTLAGVVLIALFWGLLSVLSRVPGLTFLARPAREFWLIIREGVLSYVLVIVLVFCAIATLGMFTLRPVRDSLDILSSLPRLAQVGTREFSATIPGTPPAASADDLVVPAEHAMGVSFRGDELENLTIRSSENLSVSHEADSDVDSLQSVNVTAEVDFNWRKRPNAKSPFGSDMIERLYVRNRGVDAADVLVTVRTDVVYPEVRAVPIVAISLFGVFLLYFLQSTFMPRLSAIALATFKSEIAQPLFLIILILGICILLLSIYIPYNTFGEDIKMLKDSGLTLIRVLCIILVVWGASTTLADEIEGRTALTVLSKPVRRRSFVIGKFFGIGWTTALMFIILGSVLLAVTSYKVIYDARETSNELPTWQICYLEMASVVPGLLLAFMETMTLASLSVAISTRLPMFANFMICFTVYVLGHLIPLISQATEGRFEIVKFIGRFSAAIFPNLEAFDLQTAIAGGLAVPNEYLGMSLLYCILFSVVAMLLALILFEDRDMA
jgi:ABC-type transport system involved in multi-copper enzyme maturation permease subunit